MTRYIIRFVEKGSFSEANFYYLPVNVRMPVFNIYLSVYRFKLDEYH
jgi:hypothetical protein